MYRERVPYITALADLLSAGLAAVRDDTTRAAALLRRSLTVLDAGGLALHAAVVRRRLADLVGGSEADVLRAAARSYAEREHVSAIADVTEHLAPGFERG